MLFLLYFHHQYFVRRNSESDQASGGLLQEMQILTLVATGRLDLRCNLNQPPLSLVQAVWRRAEPSPGTQNQPNALAKLLPLWVQLPAHTSPHLSLKVLLCEL